MAHDETRLIEVKQLDQDTCLAELSTPAEFARSVPDLPLHRRFRFWLPLLAAFPCVLVMVTVPRSVSSSWDNALFIVSGGNFAVSKLCVFIASFVNTLTAAVVWAASVLLGFWYIVGLGLDSLRGSRERTQSSTPGWIWILMALAFVQLIFIAVHADFGGAYTRIAFSGQLLDLSLPSRFNIFLIGYGAPVFWGAAWLVLLVQLGKWVRAHRNPALTFIAANRDGRDGANISASVARVRRTGAFAGAVLALGCIIAADVDLLPGDREWRPLIPSSTARTLLTAAATLALAYHYMKWILPEFRLRKILVWIGKQFRWRHLLRHLAFAVLVVAGLVLTLTALNRDVFRAWLHIPLVVLALAVPFALLLAFRRIYRDSWPQLRRHAVFVALLFSLLLVFQFADSALEAAVSAAIGRAHLAGVEDAYRAGSVLGGLKRSLETILPLVVVLFFTVFYRASLLPDVRLARFHPSSLWKWLVRRKPSQYLLSAIALWVLVCLALQNQQVFWSVLGYGSLILLLRLAVPKTSRYRWILYGGVLAGLLLIIVGSYNSERDLILFLAGFAIAYRYWLFAEKRGWRHTQLTAAATLFLCIWVLCSAGDTLPADVTFAIARSRTGQHEYDPERFVALRQQYPGKRIGVALSGGGYRAALMHAGVLQGLEELQIPVTNISAVSGGSITATYYALGGWPKSVLNAMLFRQFNTRRDFFDLQNAAPMLSIPGTHVQLLPGHSFGRTDVQAKALDRILLHGRTFHELPPGGPKLMICVTDLNSGSALGLTSRWRLTRFLLRPPGEELFPNVRALYGGQPRSSQVSSFALLDFGNARLSKAVAASGAFPLAFEPVLLASRQAGSFLMADGGVSDNSGMTLLLEADRRASLADVSPGEPRGDKDWALDLAISVDGGAMFQRSSEQPDLTSIDAAGRAVDIIHSRLGPTKPAEPRSSAQSAGPATVLVSPSLYMDNSRSYDYTKITMALDGIADDIRSPSGEARYKPGDRGRNLLWINDFSPEQQQLFKLVVTQITNMDRESLAVLLQKLEAVSPGYYAGLLSRLNANWLTDEELSIVQTSDSGGEVDQHALQAINGKRMTRMQTLKRIAWLVTEDLSLCLATFVKTPTLEDSISDLDARRIFRLGQYLAFLSAPTLRAPLSTPASNRSFATVTSAEQANVVCAIEVIAQYSHRERIYDWSQKAQEEQQRSEFEQRRQSVSMEFQSCLARRSAADPALQHDLSRLHFNW